jgi:hypothetical protein
MPRMKGSRAAPTHGLQSIDERVDVITNEMR